MSENTSKATEQTAEQTPVQETPAQETPVQEVPQETAQEAPQKEKKGFLKREKKDKTAELEKKMEQKYM